jgi:hypothetical protein
MSALEETTPRQRRSIIARTLLRALRHCGIKQLRDHEAANFLVGVRSVAATRARRRPHRESNGHGAYSGKRFSCLMIM